jgi:hypothetical protein
MPNSNLVRRLDLAGAPIKCFAHALGIVLWHLATWRHILSYCAPFLSDARRSASVNRCCMDRVHPIKLRWRQVYDLTLPTTERSPLSVSLLFTWRKTGQDGAALHPYVHRRWLDQALRVHTRYENVQSGMAAFSHRTIQYNIFWHFQHMAPNHRTEDWTHTIYLSKLAYSSYDVPSKILRITGFSDLVHHPVFWKLENTTFWKLDLFPSSGGRGGGG